MFLIIFLLLGVMVFLLWREWWQQLVDAKWSSPPTLQRETFSRFKLLMFLIIFEDLHHHHHHHHHGLPSLEEMVMNLGLCKMTYGLTIHVKMEKQFVFYFLR
jgi:ABC-type nickel/cobalt efflux system permease component RcnA